MKAMGVQNNKKVTKSHKISESDVKVNALAKIDIARILQQIEHYE